VAHAHARQAPALPPADWPWVEVLQSHAGADARQVLSLVDDGVKGLVVAGTANGTVHKSLLTALADAKVKGVAVRLVTRCIEGQIVGQAAVLQLAPLGLNVFKARISLMLNLMQ
jgi:L-asparaginase